jgi:hypothetical protein
MLLQKSKCLVGAVMCVLAWSGAAAAQNVVVKTFPAGSGENDAGIVDASEDTEIDGPQALTTDENGALYLLDQVNGRIVRFDPKRPAGESTILRLPGDLRPSDLIVRNSDILVWDGSVRSLRPAPPSDGTSTRGLEEVSTRAADDPSVLSAFAQMGSQQPGSAADLLDANTRAGVVGQPRTRARQHVASRGAGPVLVDVIPDSRGSGARLEVRRENSADGPPMSQLHLGVRDQLGAVEFLEIDHGGRMYVFAESLPSTTGGAGAFVARYAPTGTLEGVYELPLSNVPLARRFVTVSGDGDVYFMRTESKAVEILGVGFRRLPNGKMIEIHGAAPPSKLSRPGPVTAVRPLTRQQVIETAFAFEGIRWTLNAAAYGRDPDTACSGFNGRVRRPTYLHGKFQQEVRGIPYCWGCHGSLEQIRSKLERGVLAGNICTHNDPRSDATGVDCSAFVSAAWGLASHFTTSAIPSIASRIPNPLDLRPGDALDKPGSHVMLFLRFTADRKAEVMESSPGGCQGRVCQNVYPLASLLARGYIPVRFRALANDTSEPQVATAQAPDAGTKTPGPKAQAARQHRRHARQQ